jgi:maltose O-acetyltransferase
MMTLCSRLWPGLMRDLLLNGLLASAIIPVQLRRWLLCLYGLNIGRARISPGVWIGSSRLTVGDGSYVNYGTMFNTTAPVIIGENVDIGMRCLFVTASHEVGSSSRRAGAPSADEIVVGNGSWVGAGVVILPGVEIGPGCVIAAGSVVTKSTPSNVLVGGVPARVIRNLV